MESILFVVVFIGIIIISQLVKNWINKDKF